MKSSEQNEVKNSFQYQDDDENKKYLFYTNVKKHQLNEDINENLSFNNVDQIEKF